jgi:hypothetical protein
LQKVMTLKVAFDGNQPLIDGTINGQPIKVLVDTGSEFSFLWGSSADQLAIEKGRLHFMRAVGIGGAVNMGYARLDSLTYGDFHAEDYTVAVLPGGSGRHDYILGQDLLSKFDVEYDLAHGVINLFKPKGCAGAVLAYWTDSWAEAKLDRHRDDGDGVGGAPLRVKALINGVAVKAELDSGAWSSILSTRAAERAGITPGSPGVEPLGHTHGIGKNGVEQWGATFDSFALGEETITHAKIRIANLFKHAPPGSAPPEGHVELLLGADFFQAHHIYVANSQGKIYFTHNGGPVFQVVYQAQEEVGEGGEP